MKPILLFIFLLSVSINGFALIDPPDPQITVETRFIEVEDEFIRELGVELMITPTISNFTGINNDNSSIDNNSSIVPGAGAYAGVTFHINPAISIFGHFNINQFGNASKFDGGFNRTRFTEVGIDAGMKVHFLKNNKIDPQILLGIKTGGIAGGVNITKQNGEKDKFRFDLTGQDKRGFAGIMAGGIVMFRNDVLDFGTGIIVVGGLTQLSEPLENQDRSVPWLVEIPLVLNFFTKPKHRERDNLMIFLEPRIIEDVED